MVREILKKYRKTQNIKYILGIMIVYTLAQGLLLIVSGMWWDDWDYANKNWNYLLEVFRQSSLPFRAYVQASVWCLPQGAYRILVFLYFLLGAFLLFEILQNIEFFSKEDAYMITILYVVMPINDARITWICYGYSLSLLIFWLTFYLVIYWHKRKGKRNVLIRLLSLVLLFLSYDTESIMSMTILILLYLYYEELKDKWRPKKIRANIKICFRTIILYLDFLVAPIIFYFGKHILFPGYGYYGGHNYITWGILPKILLRIPGHALLTVKNVIDRYYNIFDENSFVVFLAFTLAVLAILAKNKFKNMGTEQEMEPKKTILLLALASFVFFVGLLPYAIIRNNDIEIIGTGGRDSLLLGLGLAMMLYYATILFVRKEARKIVYLIFVALGIMHFNFMYLEYQEDYYQQLRFRAEVPKNGNIIDNDTFLCLNRYPAFIEAYYQYNGNSWIATGEESRYYLDSTSDLARLMDMREDSFILNGCNMRDWDYSSGNHFIDGIVVINNKPIGTRDLIRLKLIEIFNHNLFEEWISNTGDIMFIPVTKEESNILIEASKEGTLTQDNLADFLEAY